MLLRAILCGLFFLCRIGAACAESSAPPSVDPSLLDAIEVRTAPRTTGSAGLPPLRIDPALLGKGPPPRPEPLPVAVAAPPTPPPPKPAPAVATTPEITPLVATAPKPAVATAVMAAPAAVKAVAPAAPARSSEPALAASPAAPAQAAAATAALSSAPPQVAERPLLPPLYSALVAAGELPAPLLKSTRALTPLDRNSADTRPNFISADKIHGRNDVEMVAEGAVELRKVGTALTADTLTYWHLDEEVEALGNVHLKKDVDEYAGPKLRMNLEENTGYFEHPTYTMPRTKAITASTPPEGGFVQQSVVELTARGGAERVDFLGEGISRLKNAVFTTCAPGNNDWHADVGALTLDYNREVAEGEDGKVVFMGVPILYSPWLNFSLNNQRKTGLLAPTFGSSSTAGAELSLPWYWNIAPNMDATITPRVMQKRGTQLNADVNYLDSNYTGQTHVEYLPDDSISHKTRYDYSLMHKQTLGFGFSGMLNVSGVSDDTYFSDLAKPASSIAQVAQGTLLRTGALNYESTWWNASLAATRYQILQDPSAGIIVTEPYRRLPQLTVAANRYDLPYGTAFNFNSEFVRFGHPTNVIGTRSIVYPQLSLPMQSSYLQVTPKLGVHVTRYSLERQDPGTPPTLTRNVPIFSLDSQVTLERDTSLFGRNAIQTLEPRLTYLYVPYRDQSLLNRSTRPVNFDTGVADFNIGEIFAENRYSGGDRIGDTNQLTATLTSRVIDPATGGEMLRALIGQRYYFTDQRVTLRDPLTLIDETPRTNRSADMLAAVSGQVLPKTYVDAGWQYNPHEGRTERLGLSGRYQPETGKVVNAGYRYTRDLLGQIDVSGQWPIGGGWNGVGRYNYSTQERRIIESVGGVEYDGGCWVARVVVQRIATQIQRQTTSLFLQLELNGFSRIGANPLDILKRSVPGYGIINQPSVVPTPLPN